ncbi:hypothetical protein BJY16_007350 [Actinoplanes octamycinicus]|uniref:Uncharacterized protein n=2 Tax=Actinoplanes octamycinicus TaxID=135948 RepID=A0A7W7H4L5_9ACTN|nr:hypothetical protein [Actinoplanes octamycinicus]MBB4743891.1 hypothetical protein [Actinoplanes octamycinicus]
MSMLVAAATFIAEGAFAAPATASSSFTFDASPEPVKKGAYVTLSGRGVADAEIDFYFKADGKSTWVYQNYTRTASDGRYSRRQAQNNSGTWKAVEWYGEDAQGPSRTDHVQVRGVQLPGVVTHYGGYYATVKPSSFDPSTTTPWWFTGVRWTRLTATAGAAVGTMHVNDCEPDCADGKYRTERVTLTFRRVRSHHGAPVFTEFRVDNDPYWTPLTPNN